MIGNNQQQLAATGNNWQQGMKNAVGITDGVFIFRRLRATPRVRVIAAQALERPYLLIIFGNEKLAT
jgi:hypothetical protein